MIGRVAHLTQACYIYGPMRLRSALACLFLAGALACCCARYEVVTMQEQSDAGEQDGGKAGSAGDSVNSGGSAGWGVGGFGACGVELATAACVKCVDQMCVHECTTCEADPECVALFQCVKLCYNAQSCAQKCIDAHPVGSNDMSLILGCVQNSCPTECNSPSG